MKDITENQKQFIRNWVAIRNTEVEEIDGEIDKVIQNSPITKKEFLDILVIHNKDKKDCDDSDKKNVNFFTTNTLMKTKKDKINLAKFIINQARIFMSKK